VAVETANLRAVLVDADSSAGPARPPTVLTSLAGTGATGTPIASSDHRTLFAQGRQGLLAIPSTGGVFRELVRYDDALHPHATNARNVAGHAGFLYFTLQNPQSNIWIARVTGLER
jgi:hypothetical protein